MIGIKYLAKFLLSFVCLCVNLGCVPDHLEDKRGEIENNFISLDRQIAKDSKDNGIYLRTIKGIVCDSLPNSELYTIDKNIYSSNNITYRLGNRILYDFTYVMNHDTASVYCLFDSIYNVPIGWTTADTITNGKQLPIKQIELEVLVTPGPLTKLTTGYTQTEIKYTYYSRQQEIIWDEHTGIIDNEENIWLHPPRMFLLQCLQTSPWPFIRAPFTVGNTWTRNHQIAYDSVNYFSSGSLKMPWNALLRNISCRYEISHKENLIVGSQNIVVECLVGIGHCRNSVHPTSLKYWFNPNIGFLKLVFNNMDGSTIIFNAIGFEVCS